MWVKKLINIHQFCLCVCLCADTYRVMVHYFLLEIIQTEVFQPPIKQVFFPRP